MRKDEIEAQIAVLELLKELDMHPTRSIIVFVSTNPASLNEENTRYNCAWYDNVGKGFPLENIVRKPKEWQNLTREQVIEVAKPFDTAIVDIIPIRKKHQFIEHKNL